MTASHNRKISGVDKMDATYTSITRSCPKDCSLMSEGCYAQLSYVGMTTRRLDEEASSLSTLQVAQAEAFVIDSSHDGSTIPPHRTLRLHVGGDSRTLGGTRLINKAVGRWLERGGESVFSYTHAWKKVPRHEWSNVSMLASVSNVTEAVQAREQGYVPAIVVSEFDSTKAFKLGDSDTKWIPCPAQTKPAGKDIACTDCKLCFNTERLYQGNFGIAFAAHGVRKHQLKRHLKVVA